MKKTILVFILIVVVFFSKAQNGLEKIFVERYYVTDSNDSMYSIPTLPVGSVTYRIYADLLPGYKVQSIFGSIQHQLVMSTTTYFFNQSDYGSTLPTFSANNAKKNTVMIDSWLSTGGACNGYLGIPKTGDNGVGNFVNSNVPQLLQNNAPQAGIPLTIQDGMYAGSVPSTITLGLSGLIDVFGDGSTNGNQFYVNNGAWSCLSGASGPIPSTNQVLIAQITTNGTFHFELNIQIGTPSLGTEIYVSSNPAVGELTIPSLIQTLYAVPLPPQVYISEPVNNSSYSIGAPISFMADANDPDGNIAQVEFFVDGSSIGIDASPPYSTTYIGLSSSNHILTVKATDNDSLFTISTPINITIAPQSHNVTFNVDLSRESISSNGVHISGSFNNWDPTTNPMVEGLNKIFSTTLSLIEGQEYTYRFVNGISNPDLEFVPADCGVPNGTGLYNRSISIPFHDTIIDTVCFSMCSHCPVDIPVTFKVDMTNQSISPNGVFLAGTFNGWNTSATPMTAGADNVYSVTLMLTPSSFHLYRFINGNDPSGFESVPSECGSPSTSGGFDRYLNVPENDTALTPVCFSSCIQCGSSAEYVNITFRVDIQEEFPSPNGVHISGSFQGWQPASTAMIMNSDSTYTYTQSFLAGSEILYKYLNGNTVNDYETVPSTCSLNGSRHLIAPVTDTILPLVCFSHCDSCSQQNDVMVTFTVDLAFEQVSPSGVHLCGDFEAWDPSGQIMTLLEGEVYSVAIPLNRNNSYSYRFINGNSWNDAEIVPAACSVSGNRLITPLSDSILSTVCFAKCGNCSDGLIEKFHDEFHLEQNFPNPFRNSTQINFGLPFPGDVTISLYNCLGKLQSIIYNSYSTAGEHSIVFENIDLPPGFYTYQLNFSNNNHSATLNQTMLIR
jgi:hypothetical protein